MTVKELAANMYKDYKSTGDLRKYKTEEMMSVLNFVDEMASFFTLSSDVIIASGLYLFADNLRSTISWRRAGR